MRTEQGKRKWVKAYLDVKFAELVAFAVVVVGSGIVTSMYMDPAMFWPVLRALLCAAYIWEMIFIFYRVFFLYPGEKLAILWMALAILEVPGWYALFRDLTGIQFLPVEPWIYRLWLLVRLTPLLVVFSFCVDINIISRSEDSKIDQR